MDIYQKAKNIGLTLIGLLGAKSAQACSVCFTSVEDEPQAIGLKWAVLTLLAIVLIVLGFSGKFIWDITRREKLMMTQNLGNKS